MLEDFMMPYPLHIFMYMFNMLQIWTNNEFFIFRNYIVCFFIRSLSKPKKSFIRPYSSRCLYGFFKQYLCKIRHSADLLTDILSVIRCTLYIEKVTLLSYLCSFCA